jgi:hypothetical protein
MVHEAILQVLEHTIFNLMIIYRNDTGKRIDQTTFRIQLVDGLFVKYANAAECKVLSSHSSESTYSK